MRSDLQIEHDVVEELSADPEVAGATVVGRVAAGIAQISGAAPSYAARLAAGRAAERVCGVREVINDVVVEPPPRLFRRDVDIARSVRTALDLNVLVPPGAVHATVTGGWVVLDGRMSRQFARCAAEATVAMLAGVRGIQNRIRLESPQSDNPSLVLGIELALRRSAELDCKHILIETEPTGGVLLRGTVRSWAERHDAERAAWSTPGVREVTNRLVVVL
jgi:osmotically-inducible protein OsmY